MARKTFFSFHYKPDVQRANVVKKSQVLKDREDAGFFDSSAFEKAKNENPDSLKRFLRKEMEGSSVVCILAGSETAHRRWVRFEALQALVDGRGLVAIRIHNIRDWAGATSNEGPNPLDLLGVYVKDRRVRVVERNSTSAGWSYTTDFGQQVLSNWPYQPHLPAEGNHALSSIFLTHGWSTDAHNNVGDWLEAAALQAGK